MEFCNISDFDVANGSRICPSIVGATIVSPVVMFLAGVIGNILALSALYRTRTDVRATKFYTLVTSLAWTDLLGILMTSPSTIAAYVNGVRWAGGMPHCRYHGFVMTCFGLATPLIICAMAIERFLALKCVFFYSARCKNATACGVIVTLWTGVLCYGVLPLFGIGAFEKQYPGTWCFLAFHTSDLMNNLYGYIYASLNLIAISVMLFCNVYVMFTLIKTRLTWETPHPRKERLLSDGKDIAVGCRHVKPKQKAAEVQMIVLLCAITTVFALCWSPLMIQIIITMATGRKLYLWDLTAVRLASLNQTLDPWLYILLRRSFCVKVKKLFKRLYSKLAKTNRPNVPEILDRPSENAPSYEPQQFLGVFSRDPRLGTDCRVVQPDLIEVLNSALGRNTNSDKPQLPDIAATGQLHPECVCQIHIEKNKATDIPEDGIYVKFLILSKDRDLSRSNNSSHYISVCNKSPSRSRSSNIQSVIDAQTDKQNSPDDQIFSAVSTKETIITETTASPRGSLK